MFDIKFQFSILGVIIFMLPMLINIVYFKYPPLEEGEKPANDNRVVELIEQGSRILYAGAICFIVSNQKIDFKSLWLYIGILFLILYYIVWIRYFVSGRNVELLGKNFFFVPMPLAIFPILYFICAAVWVHNYIALIFMVIHGIAHNVISYFSLHN